MSQSDIVICLFSSLLVELVSLGIITLPEHHHFREVDNAALLEGFLVIHRSEGSSVQYELLPVVENKSIHTSFCMDGRLMIEFFYLADGTPVVSATTSMSCDRVDPSDMDTGNLVEPKCIFNFKLRISTSKIYS